MGPHESTGRMIIFDIVYVATGGLLEEATKAKWRTDRLHRHPDYRQACSTSCVWTCPSFKALSLFGAKFQRVVFLLTVYFN